MWQIKKTRTTPYHPQGNSIVERNNRGLGDALRALLVEADPLDWDLLLPHIMRVFRSTPHSTTQETPNFLMMGREVRVPDQLKFEVPNLDSVPTQQYALELQERLRRAHILLRDQQTEIRTQDEEGAYLFKPGDLVWMVNRRVRKGQKPKLQSKFVGPYRILQSYKGHTYRLERHGQESVQCESRLKLFHPCQNRLGQAPTLLEPARRPNMKGTTRARMPRDRSPIVENRVPREWIRDPSPAPPSPPSEREETPVGELPSTHPRWQPRVVLERLPLPQIEALTKGGSIVNFPRGSQ